jgi:hypothetical protein
MFNLNTQPTIMQQRLTCAQCTRQLFLIPLVESLESHLFQWTNSEPHNCVYCSQININMEHFTWSELADIHLVYSATYCNGRKLQRIYHEHFPNTMCPDYHTFTSVDRHLWETGTFAVKRQNTGRGRSVHMPKFDEDVLQCFEKNPSTSTHSVVHAVSVDHCMWTGATSFRLAKCAVSTRPQWLPSLRPICLLVCAPV